MPSNADIIQRDLKVLWHPCTQMKDFESLPMLPVERGEGVWLYDFDGNRYIDAISSWWVTLFGHSNPRINNRIKDQIDKLEHVILAGCSHEPVVELSERLVNVTPPGLDHVFYADNGSSAMEIALKMSFHYWQNVGKTKKTKFATLGNSYHGETLATLAVGDVDLYKKTYEPLLFDVFTAPSPDCFYREKGESWEEYSRRQFQGMLDILAKHHEEICAVTVEPLVQCAGGMRMYDPIYLKLLRQACDKYGVHLIADEIAVGFGRTGTMFACEQAGIAPDFMALSKGLTSGYLPLSAVLMSDDIFQAFYDDYDTLRAFLHSHSFTGNPLCCAAALATLDIFETDNVIERNRELSAHLGRALERFQGHPHVGDIRQTGMIAAVEMVKDPATREAYDWRERRGMRVYQHALTREALLRPLGNVCYFMPPYVITEEQIDHLVQVAEEGIDIATRD
jgi:adenosylmethionine-8-amino-7-oxononanoate aminotransferase